jgi:cysteine synthase A
VKDKRQHRLNELSALVGNTPLLAVDCEFRGRKRTVYAKAEHLNMTGSIKDRMAFYIMAQGYTRGLLKQDDLIAEATSGNTGIAFSAIGCALGHRVVIFMPDWMSGERINLIRSLGAEIRLVSEAEGGFIGCVNRAEEFAKDETNVFLPRQFSNADNIEAHYASTGPEIWWQLQFHSLIPDAFVAGVGTGGTVMGVGRFLRERNPAVKLHPLEPSNSPILSTGENTGHHRIQGISDEFIPPIVNLDYLDEVVDVDDGDAILMAQKLAEDLGIAVGISSGANFLGALEVQDELGPDAIVVTVFSDDNKKYLSTDLLGEEPIKKEYLTPDVDLHEFRAIKRVCYTCCQPQECRKHAETISTQDWPLPCCPRWETEDSVS